MAKRHYIPVTADVPGAASEGNCALIRKVIRTALAAEGVDVPCEVDVLLTNDSGIHEINREMRQVDASTDVLSFPEFDLRPGELPAPEDADPGTGLVPLGDMVISMEHVAAQAKEYGHSNRRELAYLVVHSVLHLLGYDHLDEGPQKKQMRAREEAILAELGITREETERFKALDSAPWLRILGFRRDALPLLSEIKKHSTVPMITKTADAAALLSGPSLELFYKHLQCAELYRLAAELKTGRPMKNEFTRSPVII